MAKPTRVPNQLTQLKQHVAKLREDAFAPPLEYRGLRDPIDDEKISAALRPCKADPRNPFACFLANNALLFSDTREKIQKKGGGPLIAASFSASRGYSAHIDADGLGYYIVLWDHDCPEIVKAYDNRDDKKALAKMKARLEENPFLTMFKFRKSQTPQGRKEADEERKRKEEEQKANGTWVPKPKKSVPNRGNRPNGGVSPRRLYDPTAPDQELLRELEEV